MKKLLLTVFVSMWMSASYAGEPSGLKCSRDDRPGDGDLYELTLSKSEDGKFQVELNWEAGGLCQDGACQGKENATVLKGLKCSFGKLNKRVIHCSRKPEEGESNYSLIQSYYSVTTKLDLDFSAKPYKWVEKDNVSTRFEIWSPVLKKLDEENPLNGFERLEWTIDECQIVEEME